MMIGRVDPFRDLAVLQDRVNRLFNDTFGGRSREDDVLSQGSWTPPVDIYETEGGLVLKVDLPDLRREDIGVTVENHTLTLSGERRLDAQVKEESYHRIERAHGRFARSFSLPSTVDAARIGAEYRNGLLTITLPFREEARPRSITVDVAA
jgi:HSP20 family protein